MGHACLWRMHHDARKEGGRRLEDAGCKLGYGVRRWRVSSNWQVSEPWHGRTWTY